MISQAALIIVAAVTVAVLVVAVVYWLVCKQDMELFGD